MRRHPDAPGGSWRPGDAELGSIVENRIDEAYMLSWPEPLEIWMPVHDTGGYDRARAPMGSYDFRLDQIKGTTSLHDGNEVHISFETPVLHPRENVHFTIVYYDLAARGPADPVWKFNSTELEKVCSPDPTHPNRWAFVASRSGHARDRASRHQIALRDLAGSNGWSVLPPRGARLPSPSGGGSGRGLPGVSTKPLETSAFFKRTFDAAFLQAATGDEMLMAAQPDIFGRHRLAFSKSTGAWVSVAIHGGTITKTTQLIQANIHAATFVPHPNHFILVQHFDGQRDEWYPWSWLIPSTEFARLARGKGAYLLFTTTLNPHRVNHWTPFRIPTSDVAASVLAALEKSRVHKAA